jgi:hypothetical protein
MADDEGEPMNLFPFRKELSMRSSTSIRVPAEFLVAAALFMVGTTHAATPTQAASAGARLAKMAEGSTTSCKVGQGGNIDCLLDTVHTTVSECAGDYAWGQVSSKDGVTLESAFDKAKAKPTAHLAGRQFVCVAATAGNKQIPDRLYVIAFPVKNVPGCKENDLCQEHPQTWVGAKPEGPCHWVGKDGAFTGACAAGWVDPDSIEVFSMGLQ